MGLADRARPGRGNRRAVISKEPVSMPLYTVTTPDGLLSAQQRDVIAAELTRIHMAAMHVPANFVHSIFPTYREVTVMSPRNARRSPPSLPSSAPATARK